MTISIMGLENAAQNLDSSHGKPCSTVQEPLVPGKPGYVSVMEFGIRTGLKILVLWVRPPPLAPNINLG